jgi:hypothetical protein
MVEGATARGGHAPAMAALIRHLFDDSTAGSDPPTPKDVFRTCVALLIKAACGVPDGDGMMRSLQSVSCSKWADCMGALLKATGVITRVEYVASDVTTVTYPSDFDAVPDDLPLSAYTVTFPTAQAGRGMQLRFAIVVPIDEGATTANAATTAEAATTADAAAVSADSSEYDTQDCDLTT